jgi:signal peptidase I
MFVTCWDDAVTDLPLENQPIELARPRLQTQGFMNFVREIVETVILVGAIYALVNLATARFIVEGPSMQPNFHTGQFVLVSRVNYMLTSPTRGDIVVFHYPRDPDEDYIKRIIGTPGDTVEIRNQQVYVNGVALEEPYINEPCSASSCRDEVFPTLQENQYFVMGDNRNHSQDSRAFGVVDRQFIVGEALVRYWPPSDWGIVNRIAFP